MPETPVVDPKPVLKWKSKLEEGDILAAEEYLTLCMPRELAKTAIAKFREHATRIEFFKAKDILRACNLPPLNTESTGVQKKLTMIEEKDRLHVVLLVYYNGRTLLADGYHRTSATYLEGETERVACVLIHLKD